MSESLVVLDDSMSEVESQVPLPPLTKLVESDPTSHTSDQMVVKNKPKGNLRNSKTSTKQTVKETTECVASYVPEMKSWSEKNSESSTEKLLMNLMEEVKNMKIQINTFVISPTSVSQTSSSSSNLPIIKCIHCGKKNHHESMCFSKLSDQVTNVLRDQSWLNQRLDLVKDLVLGTNP